MMNSGLLVLPDLYEPTYSFLTTSKRRAFKKKRQVSTEFGATFLPFVPYRPKYIEAEFIESWPIDGPPVSSQLWHRDTHDGPHCIRAMIYLCDVTLENGPFCYAPGTNDGRDYQDLDGIGLTLTGPKGTTILFDIMGYHRGLKNVSGNRQALVYTYHTA